MERNQLQKNSSKKTTSSSTSSTTKKVQAQLNKLGYNCGTPDGSRGPKTIAAIKKFQKAKGLKVDGSAGPATRRAMGI